MQNIRENILDLQTLIANISYSCQIFEKNNHKLSTCIYWTCELYVLYCGNFKSMRLALAGVAQWIECWPVNQRVTGLIPSQGTCLGCWPRPQ